MDEQDPSRIPSLPAYADQRGLLHVWCAHCGRWHDHGRGGGHRVAHCGPGSPYCATGYTLVEAGPWTAAVRRQHEQP
jgi:hypothetical protein